MLANVQGSDRGAGGLAYPGPAPHAKIEIKAGGPSGLASPVFTWERELVMTPIREDFAGQRQLRFRVDRKPLHIFKHKGESTHQVFLKVLAYAFYADRAELTFDPKTDSKLQPTLAEIDYTGEVKRWVHVGLPPLDKLEYVLRHSSADEVCVVLECPSDAGDHDDTLSLHVEELVARIKRHIHYRYTTGKLKLLVFESLERWFDPEADVDPHPAHHVFYSF